MTEMSLIDEIVSITPQRPIAEVAAECDVVFTDNTAKYPGMYMNDPFKAALDVSREQNKICMAVFDKYYLKIVPDATWMRAMRLYQEMRTCPPGQGGKPK